MAEKPDRLCIRLISRVWTRSVTCSAVAEIARAVGYSDAFGFSAAFTRIRGVNSSEFRRTSTGGDDTSGTRSPTPNAPDRGHSENQRCEELSARTSQG